MASVSDDNSIRIWAPAQKYRPVVNKASKYFTYFNLFRARTQIQKSGIFLIFQTSVMEIPLHLHPHRLRHHLHRRQMRVSGMIWFHSLC